MSKDKLRSRKKIEEQINEARTKDQQADLELAELLRSMLKLCSERDVEPETVLYRLLITTNIARGELVKKHHAQFFNDENQPKGKVKIKLIRDDYGRLEQAIYDQSMRTQEEKDKPHTKDPRTGSSSENKPVAKKFKGPLRGYY